MNASNPPVVPGLAPAEPPAPRGLVGFEGDPRLDTQLPPLNVDPSVDPVLSAALPLCRVVRDPEEAVTSAEAGFSTQVMIILLDYLDARYELGIIADRDDPTDRARNEAVQAIGSVISRINQPYIDRRFAKSRAASVLLAGAARAAPEPDHILRQRDLDEVFRRVVVYALAVVNSARRPS